MAERSAFDGVGISNRSESGMDCEIDEIPRSLRDGPTVVKGEVLRASSTTAAPDGSPRFHYDIELATSGKPSDAAKVCSGAARTYDDVAAFTAEEVMLGETVCVSGNMRAQTMCTQKGCGY